MPSNSLHPYNQSSAKVNVYNDIDIVGALDNVLKLYVKTDSINGVIGI